MAKKKVVKKTAAEKVSKAAESKAYSLTVGDSAPAISAVATSGKKLNSSALKGRLVVLYFYPKDSTPGCTLEGQDFKRLQKEFSKLDCEILGVSKDSLRSHENFKAKCGFPFELISDEDGSLCKAFDVIQKKKLYGREFVGIERSTFLISKKGKIAAEWRKVKVPGHAEEVLEAARKEAKA